MYNVNGSGNAGLTIPARIVVVQAWHVLYLTTFQARLLWQLMSL